MLVLNTHSIYVCIYIKKNYTPQVHLRKSVFSCINNVPNQKDKNRSVENKETLSEMHPKEPDTRQTAYVSVSLRFKASRSQCVRTNLGENYHRHMYNAIKRFTTLPWLSATFVGKDTVNTRTSTNCDLLMQITAVEQEETQTPSTNINSFLAYNWGKTQTWSKRDLHSRHCWGKCTVAKAAITKRQIILYWCGMLREIPAKHLQVV